MLWRRHQSKMQQSVRYEKHFVIIYDGECVYCSRYAEFVRLRTVVGKVELISARSNHPLVKKLQKDGIDFDEGMVVLFGDKVFHGVDAFHFLSFVASPAHWFNKLIWSLAKVRFFSGSIYPVLKFGRLVTLRLRGIPLIHE